MCGGVATGYASCAASTRLSLFWPVLSGNGRYLVLLDSTVAGGVAVTVTPNPL